MSTRALQFDILSGGITYGGELITNPYVRFFAAGTNDAKNAWDDKEKASAITKKALDSNGRGTVYGDGIYKLKFYTGDPDAAPDPGVLLFELDSQKIQATTYSVVQKVGTYTATPDDDVILCNGTFTVNLDDVALFDHPLTIKNIGTGTITVDPYSTQTIDGNTTLAIEFENDLLILIPDTASTAWRRGNKGIGQTYVTNTNGNPNISDTGFDLEANLALSTWESVGPTGSGANNIWTALDVVPADVDFIRVRCVASCSHSSGGGSAKAQRAHVRKNGSTQAASDTLNSILHLNVYGDVTYPDYANSINDVDIPVSNRVFDAYYYEASGIAGTSAILFLVGYGYNR